MLRFAAPAALAWGTLSAAALAARLPPAPPTPSAPFPIAIASQTSALEPGSSVLVSWTAGAVGTGFDEMELVLSVDGGRSFPVRVTRRIAPDEGAYAWTVPSLPAAQARLALRAGSDEEEDEETIVGVSAEFAIAPSSRGDSEELFRVGDEERTRDALEDVPPPRLPDSSLGAAWIPVADSDLLEPPERGLSPAISAPDGRMAERTDENHGAHRASARPPQPPAFGLPMRL